MLASSDLQRAIEGIFGGGNVGAAVTKFRTRFEGVERLAAERGIDLAASDLPTLDHLWDEVKLAFPTVKDDSPERATLKAFHVYAFPTSYFIGKDGKIVSAWIGFDPQKGAERLREEFAKAGFK